MKRFLIILVLALVLCVITAVPAMANTVLGTHIVVIPREGAVIDPPGGELPPAAIVLPNDLNPNSPFYEIGDANEIIVGIGQVILPPG